MLTVRKLVVMQIYVLIPGIYKLESTFVKSYEGMHNHLLIYSSF
jgi:hypothetical protein